MPLTTSLARAAFSLVVAFVITLNASQSAHAQDVQAADARADGLTGRVHTVTGERYMARRIDGRVTEEGRHRPIAGSAYDRSGRLEQRELVDDFGAPAGHEAFIYEDGRLLEAVVRDAGGVIVERRRPHYATGGAVDQLSVLDGAGDGYIEKYVRGESGRLNAIVYLVGAEEMGRSLFTYGTGPEPSEVAFVSADGEAATAPLGPCLGAHRVVMTYNEGRVAERALYRTDGSLKQRTVFGYDPAGNVASELRSTAHDMDRLTHTYELDAAGNWTRRVSAMEYDVKAGEPPRANALLSITLRTLTYY